MAKGAKGKGHLHVSINYTCKLASHLNRLIVAIKSRHLPYIYMYIVYTFHLLPAQESFRTAQTVTHMALPFLIM